MIGGLLSLGGALLNMLDPKNGQIDKSWQEPQGTIDSRRMLNTAYSNIGATGQNMQASAQRKSAQSANVIGNQMGARFGDADTGAAATNYANAINQSGVLNANAQAGQYVGDQQTKIAGQMNDLNTTRESSMNNGNGLGALGQNILGGLGHLQGTMMNSDKLAKSQKGSWLAQLMNFGGGN